MVGFSEDTWLESINAVLDGSGGECRTLEVAQRLRWGSIQTGTQGLDLVAFKELLKGHPELYELQGQLLRRVTKSVAEPSVLFDEDIWPQRVRTTVEEFGCQCTVEDIADSWLWGLAGTGTEQRNLRAFLLDHPDTFTVHGTAVSLHLSAKRHLESSLLARVSGAWGPEKHFARVDDELLVQRVRQAIWLQSRYGGADCACTTQDLFRILNWGRVDSGTCGRCLRDFLLANHETFRIDGYSVYLRSSDELAVSEIDRRVLQGFHWPSVPSDELSTRRDSARDQDVDPGAFPALGSAEHSENNLFWLPRIQQAIERLGGACNITDIADLLLWESWEVHATHLNLRDFLRMYSNCFHIDGTGVSLHGDALEREERYPDMVAQHLDLIVRSFGGTCTSYDISRKLKWGASGSGSFGKILGEFLDTQADHLKLGGAPTTGSCLADSDLTVSLRGMTGLEIEAWLQRIEDLIRRCGGQCSTRDIFLRLDWGLPGTSSQLGFLYWH